MRKLLLLSALVLPLTAAAPALAEGAPASGPRDRVERDRGQPRAKPSPEEKKARRERRPRRQRSGGGDLVVVPGSELSSSPDRSRGDDRGLRPAASPVRSFQALIGRDERNLTLALGAPETARDEAGGAMWTYRLPSCALYVFLARDERGALRVKGGSTGPLRRGAPTPELDACVAEAKPS